MDVMMVSKP